MLTKKRNVKSQRTFASFEISALLSKNTYHNLRQRLYPIKTVDAFNTEKKESDWQTTHALSHAISAQVTVTTQNIIEKQIRCEEKWDTLIVMTRFAVSNGHLLADACHLMLLACCQSINLMPWIKFDDLEVITTLQECLFIYNPKCAIGHHVVTVRMSSTFQKFQTTWKIGSQLEINRFQYQINSRCWRT